VILLFALTISGRITLETCAPSGSTTSDKTLMKETGESSIRSGAL